MRLFEIDMGRSDLNVTLKDDIKGTIQSQSMKIIGMNSIDVMHYLHTLYDKFQPDSIHVECSGFGILPYDYFSQFNSIKPKLKKMRKTAW